MTLPAAASVDDGSLDLAIEMRGIEKSYRAVQALRGVDLTVERGTIHAVLGENGAGKSTLIEILAGTVTPDRGSIRIAGEEADSELARRAGIAVVHQHLSLAPNVTVAENLLPSALDRRFGFVSWRRVFARAQELLDRHGVPADARAITGDLSLAVQQQVEIARALSSDAQVIALDEPTSSLSVVESRALLENLKSLRADGRTVVVITHFIADALAIADHGSVLRDGELVDTFPMGSASEADILKMMAGRELASAYPTRSPSRGGQSTDTDTRGVTARVLDSPIELRARPGEVVGLYGLVGAGRSELLEAIFGLRRAKGVEVEIEGRPLPRNRRAADAMRAGIAFLPENRTTEGLFLGRSVAENIAAPQLDSMGRWMVDNDRLQAESKKHIKALSIKGGSDTIVGQLSGGNQQKVLFARWLSTSPQVLMVDEPTRGVDVATKGEIHRALRAVADEGRVVIMASSEMPEVLGMSDRVYVMAAGRIADEVSGEEATAERLLESASQLPKRSTRGSA